MSDGNKPAKKKRGLRKHKIVEGLEAALAYAKGDESKGRVTVVHVRPKGHDT